MGKKSSQGKRVAIGLVRSRIRVPVAGPTRVHEPEVKKPGRGDTRFWLMSAEEEA